MPVHEEASMNEDPLHMHARTKYNFMLHPKVIDAISNTCRGICVQ